MSRPNNKWFTHSDDSDDSDSDMSSMGSSFDDEETPQGGRSIPNRFLGSDDESSDESDGGRVVKSKAERRMKELNNVINRLEDNVMDNAWKLAISDFDSLNKTLNKTLKVEKISEIPAQYLQCVIDLEETTEDLFKDKKAQKKLKADDKRSLRKLRTQIQKNNKQYEDAINRYKENPDAFKEEEPEVEEEEEEEEETPGFTFQIDEEDISDEESEEEWDESDEEVEESGEEDEEEEVEKEKEPKKAAKKASSEHIEIKEESVEERLADVIFQRGKRGTDSRKQVEKLEALLEDCDTMKQKVQVLVTLVAALFDTVKSTSFMDTASWRAAYQNLSEVIKLIKENAQLEVVEAQDEVIVEAEHEAALKEEDEQSNRVKIIGNFTVFVQRLHTEFMHSLSHIHPQNPDYVNRMQDQALFMDIAEKVFFYYQRKKAPAQQARIGALIVEHLYYRRQEDHTRMYEKKVEIVNNDSQGMRVVREDLAEVMHNLSNLIFEHGDKRSKNRTMLCLIYHHALHDRFEKASNLMLMSHLQDGITLADVPTQILFNRTMAQLGMCAFRCGQFKDAHSCLADLCSSAKLRELLAQGFSSRDGSHNEQLIEGKRMLPYYMHINLEILEAMHFVSALFLEVPNMAKHPYDYKRNVISKSFRRMMDFYAKQSFSGSPENIRDHINAAAIAVLKGSWEQAFELLTKIQAWSLVPESVNVLDLVKEELKITALKTYILAYGKYYRTISVDTLATMFSLSQNTVHSTLSQMIVSNEVSAAWDQSNNALDILATPTKLQSLGLILADRQSIMADFNERVFEHKTGTSVGQKKREYYQRQGGRKRRDDKRSKSAKAM